MSSKLTFLVTALVLVTTLGPPLGGAHHATHTCTSGTYDDTQATHSYTSGGSGTAIDTCVPPDGYDNDGDGDFDLGFSGGAFPAGFHNTAQGGAFCAYANDETTSHHPAGANAPYHAEDTAFPIVYVAGADGPLVIDLGDANDIDTPNSAASGAGSLCMGDGVISSVDPLDCGSGRLGIFDPFVNNIEVSADLQPNSASASCIPVDGFVMVHIATGPLVCSTYTILSTPQTGLIDNTPANINNPGPC